MPKNVLFILLFFISLHTTAQSPEELLEKTRLNYTPEKLYIHFDKQSYIAGDTIWFKAYLMDGFLPSTKSTVLNVELLSDSGKIIGRKILPITASMAANAFELAGDLKQGSYTFSAFSTQMMNFGTANFYNKQVNIYNPDNLNTEKTVKFLPEINFLPEAGNLVAGFENTVAFKCVDNNGMPLNVVGKIINSTGEVKTTFKSTHDGMGTFAFTPMLGEKYFAECIVDGVTNVTKAMHESVSNASLFKVSNKDGKSFLEINSSNVFTEAKKPAYVLGVEENMVAFKIPLKENELITKAELPISTLPSGILKITLFSKDNQPLAERLLFVNSGDYEVKTNIVSNTINTEARKNNELVFNIDDTTVGSYSVAITNAQVGIESQDGNDHIISRFLLTDNLKGKINNPAYYFEKNDEEHAQNIDLVMLTNGWRRYSWTEILTNKFPDMVYKDPNYISFKGIAFAPYSKDPLKETELLVFAKPAETSELPNILKVKTNAQGMFELDGMLFEDTARFYIQNPLGKDRRINLKLTSPSLANLFTVSKNNIPYFNFKKPSSNQDLQIAKMMDVKSQNQRNVVLLEAIKVTTKAKTKAQLYEKKYVKGTLGANAARSLDFLNDPPPSGINIFDYLRSRLPGVTILGGPLDYTLNYRNSRSLLGGPIPMAIFLDEFQVDASQVATLPADDFALIKVFSNGPLAGVGGALALYTNKDGKGKSSQYASFSEAVIAGFSVTKEFYNPNYDIPSANDALMDNRTTLYWNPYLTADKNTKQIKVSFFNSDNAKKFKVVLEGVTRDGGLVHFEKVME